MQDASQYALRGIDRVKAKGKSKAVTVYEVFDGDPPHIIELKKQTLEDFEQLQVSEMKTLNLDNDLQDLHYFDSFIHKEIMGYPVNSLRAEGSYDNKKEV